jgi:hypothetical protein
LATSLVTVPKVAAEVVPATIVVKKDTESKIALIPARLCAATAMQKVMRAASAPFPVTILGLSAPIARRWATRKFVARSRSPLRTARTALVEATLVDIPEMVDSRAMLEAKLTISVELLLLVVIPGVAARLLLLAKAGRLLLLLNSTFCQLSFAWQQT